MKRATRPVRLPRRSHARVALALLFVTALPLPACRAVEETAGLDASVSSTDASRCVPGTKVPAADGCNTRTCSTDGKTWNETLIGCRRADAAMTTEESAEQAVRDLKRAIAWCGRAGEPSGRGRAFLTFEPTTGGVTRVELESPFEGTHVGTCITLVASTGRVPPFEGAPRRIGFSFKVKPPATEEAGAP